MLISSPNLYEEMFEIPYNNGYRTLNILSGYASAVFLTEIRDAFPELQINLIVGMAAVDGVSIWDHEQYRRVCTESDRITVRYQYLTPGNHSKLYEWLPLDREPSISFIGSANFSRNGIRTQSEMMYRIENLNTIAHFTNLPLIDCQSPNVSSLINIHSNEVTYLNNNNSYQVQVNDPDNLNRLALPRLQVSLSLLSSRDGQVHSSAGLNWGQRAGRNRNQAYIPVLNSVHRENPDFFPNHRQPFTLFTPEGDYLVCVMAQDNRKAIETTHDNSVLGLYFRRKLGLASGERVTLEHLERYGRTYVTIEKIDSERYILNF